MNSRGSRPTEQTRKPVRPLRGRISSLRVTEGFTLVELLAVIAMVVLLALMLLPALAATRPNAQAFQCQNNQKQLTLAWHMYAEDNKDLLPPNDFPDNLAYFSFGLSSGNKGELQNWVVGTMNQPLDSRTWQELVPSTSNLHTNTCLAGYVTNASVYRCPADQYIDPFSHTVHVRSYSMNSAVGTMWYDSSTFAGGGGAPAIGSAVQGGWLGGANYNAVQTTWQTYGKLTSFTKPGPAGTFVFMDENPFTVNDGSIAVSAQVAPGATYLIDFPAANHEGSSCISFADGHVVAHKWLDVRTFSPQQDGAQAGQGGGFGFSPHVSPDDPDCFYLAPITSAAR